MIGLKVERTRKAITGIGEALTAAGLWGYAMACIYDNRLDQGVTAVGVALVSMGIGYLREIRDMLRRRS